MAEYECLARDVGNVDGTVRMNWKRLRYPLPRRTGPRPQISGTVPHVQIAVAPVTDVNDELRRWAFPCRMLKTNRRLNTQNLVIRF